MLKFYIIWLNGRGGEYYISDNFKMTDVMYIVVLLFPDKIEWKYSMHVLFSFSLMICYVTTNTSFIVLYLIRPGIEPTIYHIWGEHANHYTTGAVN
jgi:hypothetical protein